MINKSSNNFTTLPNDYENSSCIKCKYSKCPKYYAGYILYLKNKGLLETKLKIEKNIEEINLKVIISHLDGL